MSLRKAVPRRREWDWRHGPLCALDFPQGMGNLAQCVGNIGVVLERVLVLKSLGAEKAPKNFEPYRRGLCAVGVPSRTPWRECEVRRAGLAAKEKRRDLPGETRMPARVGRGEKSASKGGSAIRRMNS